jgi:hypothetical protein
MVTCRNVDSLPVSLPDPKQPPPRNAKYVLELGDSNVSIPLIDYRDYYNNTIVFNVSRSGVMNVTDDAWRAFITFKFKYIDLSNNRLTSLPKILQTENLTFQAPDQLLAVDGNPFLCTCEDRWMRDWLASLGDALQHRKSVLCEHPDSSDVVRGKSVLEVTDEQFCYDARKELIMTLVKVGFLCSLFLLWQNTSEIKR